MFFKKLIAFVMVATLIVALAVPVFAETSKEATTPVPITDNPIITDGPLPIQTSTPLLPTETPVEPSEEPIITEEPIETETPIETEEPVVTEEPIETEVPVETEAPTLEPVESTEAPIETVTEAPVEPTPSVPATGTITLMSVGVATILGGAGVIFVRQRNKKE